MIKLIAVDLDGTMVNDQLVVPEETQAICKRLLTETDVRLVVATGRMFPSAMPFVKALGTKEPVVAYQGAMIRAQDAHNTLLKHEPIPLSVAEPLLRFLVAEGYSTNLYVNDTMFTNHDNPYATRYSRMAGIEPIFTHDLLSQLTAAPSKLLVIDDKDGAAHVRERLVEHFPNQLNFCISRSNFCEIIHPDASKWDAIWSLAQTWGIPQEAIMAIGDQDNDISMLSQAGVGIAMGQAPREVKAVATGVTESIAEHGAAKAIARYIFESAPLPRRKQPQTALA